MTENAKINEVLRVLFALPISAEQRLGAFFLWGMLLPEDPEGWENFLQWQRRQNNPEKTKAAGQKGYWKTPEKRRAAARNWKQENYEANQIMNSIWREENREECVEACRKWRENNPEGQRESVTAWREANPEWRAAYMRQCMEDPEFKVLHYMRNRMHAALKGGPKKVDSTKELLGMDQKEFRIYIQGQFQPGMTWENYGPVWHLDHARPCASFDFSDPAQQRKCFHWSNFQPLFAKENLQKGAAYVPA